MSTVAQNAQRGASCGQRLTSPCPRALALYSRCLRPRRFSKIKQEVKVIEPLHKGWDPVTDTDLPKYDVLVFFLYRWDVSISVQVQPSTNLD